MVTTATSLAQMIILADDREAGQGKVLYTGFFVNTEFYSKYRSNVAAILIAEGYERCIVT